MIKINNILRLPKFPNVSGTAKEFRDHDLKVQEDYPLRWKVAEFCSDIYWKLYHAIYRKLIHDPWWNFKYKYIRRHQYNIVRCEESLEPGYYDPCTLILHAPFEVFAKFMKQVRDGNTHVQWEFTEEDVNPDHGIDQEYADERNALFKEMNELYDWWLARPNREDTLEPFPELPKDWGFLAVTNEDFDDEPVMIEWKRVSKIHREAEDRWTQEDIDNLVRLAKIKDYLWD